MYTRCGLFNGVSCEVWVYTISGFIRWDNTPISPRHPSLPNSTNFAKVLKQALVTWRLRCTYDGRAGRGRGRLWCGREYIHTPLTTPSLLIPSSCFSLFPERLLSSPSPHRHRSSVACDLLSIRQLSLYSPQMLWGGGRLNINMSRATHHLHTLLHTSYFHQHPTTPTPLVNAEDGIPKSIWELFGINWQELTSKPFTRIGGLVLTLFKHKILFYKKNDPNETKIRTMFEVSLKFCILCRRDATFSFYFYNAEI